MTRTTICFALLGTLALAGGCDNDEEGTDAGGSADAGCPMVPGLMSGTPPTTPNACPTAAEMAPAPEEQMGTCCWRSSNATQRANPEFRLTNINIVAPIGSPLSSMLLRNQLNAAMEQETFGWLMRVEGADADGDITVTTGFGRRNAAGTYEFSMGAASGQSASWCPVVIPATLTGETFRSNAIPGSVTIPVFDTTGQNLQIELVLRQLEIEEVTFSEDRNCVGWRTNRPRTYFPQGMLSGFIEVGPARAGMINVPPIMTTLCAAVAGDLANGAYCDQPQSTWATPPDSLCDASGCRANSGCMSDVCDPATSCNAWRVVGHFAAAGVDIVNGACP